MSGTPPRGPLVVVGDTLLDVDIDGDAGRLAPDAPVPVVDCRQEWHRAGGAGLAASLAAGLGGQEVVLITALGADWQGDRLRTLLTPHVRLLELPLDGGTPGKIRIRAAGQPLARLDAGDGRPAPGWPGPQIEAALRQAATILVADYGRGVNAHPGIQAILQSLPAQIPVIWDPHPAGTRPGRIRLATPNRAEARGFAAAAGEQQPRSSPGREASQAARDALALQRAWESPVAVTLGEMGALLSVGAQAPFLVPVPDAGERDGPRDTCGAGDCFAATAALVIRSGGLLTEAVSEAVRRASDFVRRGGVRNSPGAPARPAAGLTGLVRAATAGPPVVTAHSGWDVAEAARARGERVIATGGCFDLLHAGHVELLAQARRLGDCLVVCLNSDSSVRALKGPGRPLVAAQDRAQVLLGLASVDAVIVFEERTPSAVLERLRPDVWVKGGDYLSGELTEAQVVRRHGGEVVLLPYTGRHSTTQLVTAARELSEPGAGGKDPI
jgi:rfaE bifunctional protein nucleotidyltransferase chain/domain